MYICAYTHTCIRKYVCIYVCKRIYTCLCIEFYIHSVYKCVYIHFYEYYVRKCLLCIYVCTRVYIYKSMLRVYARSDINIFRYIYILMYMYT